ncbi:hypothetical protein DFH27DRAFT_632373 [Peziza echinospora]|nr:hypothetical protein DFH27DRAFT_632373 [Peziza echinospora]
MAIRTGFMGYGFTFVRILQIISLGIIIGFTGHLAADVNEISAPHQPRAVVWALVTGTLFCVWALITLILHVTGVLIRYLPTAIIDFIFFPLLIVACVELSRPFALPSLDCDAVGRINHGIKHLGDVYQIRPGSGNDKFPDGQLYPYTELPFPRYNSSFNPGGNVQGIHGLNAVGLPANTLQVETDLELVHSAMADYRQWVGRVKPYCQTMKVAYGFSILNILLVALSIFMAYRLWKHAGNVQEILSHGGHRLSRRIRGRGDVEADAPQKTIGVQYPPHSNPPMQSKGGLRVSAVTEAPSAYSRPTAGSYGSGSDLSDGLSDVVEKDGEYESSFLDEESVHQPQTVPATHPYSGQQLPAVYTHRPAHSRDGSSQNSRAYSVGNHRGPAPPTLSPLPPSSNVYRNGNMM